MLLINSFSFSNVHFANTSLPQSKTKGNIFENLKPKQWDLLLHYNEGSYHHLLEIQHVLHNW